MSLLFAGGALFLVHGAVRGIRVRDLLPATVYTLEVGVRFDGHGGETRVRTFVPASDARQRVLDEEVGSGPLVFTASDGVSGRVGLWRGENVTGAQAISYRARVEPQALRFEIDDRLPWPAPAAGSADLAETDVIQVSHPELAALWERIRPAEPTPLSALAAIFSFTHRELDGAEFKGTTDALTALRLGQASCNGKSRLFVALARRLGLPARLVGGLVLTPGSKKTSHQWAEVRLAGRWVPFCPTNGYFAEIPAHYLMLYRGDQVLFAHSRHINFDYRFTVRKSVLPRPLPGAGFADEGSAGGLLAAGRELSRVFLLFPVAALVIIIFKNVVGLRSFGVFLPMLIAGASQHTGLATGLTLFLAVVLLAAVAGRFMNRLQILQAPRISVLISVITLLVIGGAALAPQAIGARVALLGLFPTVILAFTAERIGKLVERRDHLDLAWMALSTVLMIAACYAVMRSLVLQSSFAAFPELLLPVLAAQLAIGRWTGLRLTEHVRFRGLRAAGEAGEAALRSDVLGINARNLDILYRLNDGELIRIADDKLETKRLLAAAGVPIPRSLAEIHRHGELHRAVAALPGDDGFVVKPAHGSAGEGILVIAGTGTGGSYRSARGGDLTREELEAHLAEILAGTFSEGQPDEALVEERVVPHGLFRELSASGLTDVRVILVGGEPVAAMLRVPTQASGGRANLHQGAVGVPVSIGEGRTGTGRLGRQSLDRHPDGGAALSGRSVPAWSQILTAARAAQGAIPLGYVGVDVVVDGTRGPLVLEVNARPGLEIQNVEGRGLRERIAEALHGAETRKWVAG